MARVSEIRLVCIIHYPSSCLLHHSLLINLNYHVYILFSILHSLHSLFILWSSTLIHPISVIQSPSSSLHHPISVIQSPSSTNHPFYHQISVIQSPSSNLHHSCSIIPLNHPQFHTLPTRHHPFEQTFAIESIFRNSRCIPVS